MADNRDPELLRKAAQALESARAAEAKAEEAERDARRLRFEADGLMAAARRLYADAQDIGFNSPANRFADNVAAPLDLRAPSAFSGGTRGPVTPPNPPAQHGATFWSDGSPTVVGWVALVLAIIALLLGFWLWGSRGDPDATAKREAQAVVKPVADKLDKVEKQVNTNTSGISEAKADATNAISTANDAKAAATACTEHCKPAPQKPVAKPRQRTKSSAKAAAVQPQPVAAPTHSDDKRGVPFDRCIFRIRGEVKASTYVQNGEVNCPKWRDEQLQLYKQDPKGMIWEKVYPTNPQ